MTALVHVPRPEDSQGARDDDEHDDSGPKDAGHKRTKFERELRRVFIAEGILAHHTYRTIAANLTAQGWPTSKSTVANEAKAIRAEWARRHAQAFDAHVAEQLATYEALKRAVLPKALHGAKDKGPSLGAVDRALAIEDRIARLLGLDKPQRIEATVTVSIEEERERGLRLVHAAKEAHDRVS